MAEQMNTNDEEASVRVRAERLQRLLEMKEFVILAGHPNLTDTINTQNLAARSGSCSGGNCGGGGGSCGSCRVTEVDV